MIEQFTFARGGEFHQSLGVYEATLAGFRQRLFGWGTERDVEGAEYPRRLTGEYLAALYRQGVCWGLWRLLV